MSGLDKLPAIRDGKVHVVVEAGKGMNAKCTYDPGRGLFVLGKPLPHGLVYPFDWGFIPGTRGEDGDPLDALILHDAACPVGCLVECRPLAVLQVEQTEKGRKPLRNDRFVFLPDSDDSVRKGRLTARLKKELEKFFEGVAMDKALTFLGWKDGAAAMRLIRKSMKRPG